MKKIVKIVLAMLILTMTLSLCSCDVVETGKELLGKLAVVLEDMIFETDYSFSDVTLVQKGINEFEISFTADTGDDEVQIFVSNSFSKVGNADPEQVTKTDLGDGKVSYRFTKELPLGEDRYIWIVCGEKSAMTALTVPSTFIYSPHSWFKHNMFFSISHSYLSLLQYSLYTFFIRVASNIKRSSQYFNTNMIFQPNKKRTLGIRSNLKKRFTNQFYFSIIL